MDIELTPEESAAVQAALRRYVSDLRMEIVDTDNPDYKRTLREEREALESALTKLDTRSHGESSSDDRAADVRVIRIWWSATSG
jgi:hypothetical protein